MNLIIGYAKSVGFTGKTVINPRQIDFIHKIYTSTNEEICKAYRIVKEFNKNKVAGIEVLRLMEK